MTVVCPENFAYVNMDQSLSLHGCYHVVLDSMNWTAATERCISLHQHAHLLSINTADEQAAVTDLFLQYPGADMSLKVFFLPFFLLGILTQN